jgi:predicted RNase H-like HicB family nuclease
MIPRYSMSIRWSEIDDAYLVWFPDFEGLVMQPCTHGETYELAAKNGREVLELLMEHFQAEGQPLPEPSVYVYETEEAHP